MQPAFVTVTIAMFGASLFGQPLAGTSPLTLEGEIDVLLMDGAHRFVERKITESIESRRQHWKRDFSSAVAYERSIGPNRKRFIEKIGAVDPLTPVALERFGQHFDSGVNPDLIAETKTYKVFQVRWTVLDGVHGEGLLLEPAGKPSAVVVALPDARQTPEQIAGLSPGVEIELQYARLLAESGCAVLVPALVNSGSDWSGRPDIKITDQPHREWIYRQAFHMGRHVIGYEVQKVRGAVEWLRNRHPGTKAGVAGYGEGGLVAFYAAASDQRIDAALVSGYFNIRQNVWSEPIYRNVWGLLEEFGDAEIATLIAPRALVVQTTQPVAFKTTKGSIEPLALESIKAEFGRIESLLQPGFQQRFLASNSREALDKFLGMLSARYSAQPQSSMKALLHPSDGAARQRRQVKELENHVQRLVQESEKTRRDFFLLKAAPNLNDGPWSTKLRHSTVDPKPFIARAARYRELSRRNLWAASMSRWLAQTREHARSTTRRIGQAMK